MNEPNWSCEYCGKRYYRHPCFFRNGRKKTCSRTCGERNKNRRVPIEQRFWKYVRKTPGCWLWTAFIRKSGYGTLTWYDGETEHPAAAHRVSYEIHHGPIPEGMHVLHKCDNPTCVRPDHLFVGTNSDNVADMVSKGRQQHGDTHCHAVLDGAKVAEIRRRVAGGERPSHLAREFGVSPPTISDLLHGRTWQHIN